jgi:hypothetical protein
MSIEYRGTPDPQRQRKTRRYNPEGGYMETTDWSAFSESQIIAMFNWGAGQGLDVEMTSRGGRHEITITDTRGETRIDRWEFGVSEEQPSLLQNPHLDVNVNGGVVAAADRFVIAIALKYGVSLEEALIHKDVEDKYGSLPAIPTGSANRVRRIHELMANNQTQYQTGNLVLRHTTNVSNRYDVNISDLNENSIYYQADFLSEVQSTALWIFPLPGRMVYKAQSFFSRHNPAARDYYLYGWLKSVSPETAVSNQRVEIQTTYKLDFWSTDVYQIAT